MGRVTFKKINNVLLGLIILINGYVIAGPFVPAIIFHAQSHSAREQLQRKLDTNAAARTSSLGSNGLLIPSMLLDQPILEGTVANQYKVLNQGIWRWPRGSTPDRGGNTVLIGHRFTYTNPHGVFYFLNKVKIGDDIGVIWNRTSYTYKVANITEVPPTDTTIESPSSSAKLTLFTCTPLWLPKDRLVVVANLEAKP